MAEVFNEKMQSNHILQVMEIVERLRTTTERWKVLPSCRNSELRPLPQGQPTKGGGKSTGRPVERGVEGTLPVLQEEGGRWGKGGGMDSSLCSE